MKDFYKFRILIAVLIVSESKVLGQVSGIGTKYY